MLGNIGQPRFVKTLRSEITLDEVITYRRTRLQVATPTLGDHQLDTGHLTQPPHAPFTDLVPEVMKIIGKDPVATLGIIPWDWNPASCTHTPSADFEIPRSLHTVFCEIPDSTSATASHLNSSLYLY